MRPEASHAALATSIVGSDRSSALEELSKTTHACDRLTENVKAQVVEILSHKTGEELY